jgi:hypothetical protein
MRNSYSPTTHALLINLAVRCRDARRRWRRALKAGEPDAECIAEIRGNAIEAWNSYQTAKQLVAETHAQSARDHTDRQAEAEPAHPVQPLLMDKRGTLRFKQNAIVVHLLEAGPIDMNHLATMTFSREDREQFAQLIGYSHDGAGDLSYFSEATWQEAQYRYFQRTF